MVTNLCFGLTCLLIPVLIELFSLQANLDLSNTGHALVEVLILCGIYWLFIQILRLDEKLYLQNYIHQNTISKLESRKAWHEDHVKPTAPAEQTPIRQPKAAVIHGPRLPFENILKNHRIAKP